MTTDITLLRGLGRQLGEFVLQRQGGATPTPAVLQGVVADLTAGMSDLQAPLRDLVSRQSFGALLPHARSRGGSIQRDALIQEISRVYHPEVLVEVEEVLNGFLDASGGIAISLCQAGWRDNVMLSPSLRDEEHQHPKQHSANQGGRKSDTTEEHPAGLVIDARGGVDKITSSILKLAGVPCRKT